MSSVLYSEVKGAGKNVVLLHGWGMHGGLWGRFSDLLADGCRCHVIDLPGYGYSKDSNNEFTIDSISKDIEDYINYINQEVTIIGWSLGGLITLNLLKRKNIDINKIVLIATTPKFTKDEDSNWLSAMEQKIFDNFSIDLQSDYKKTLKRFLSLQTRGSELARDDLRLLNQKLIERGDPNIDALKNGLKILSDADLRSDEKDKIPAMLVLGEKDTLVPVDVKSKFCEMFSNIELLVLEKTGHAPFISKPELCAENIKNFINE